MRFSLLYYSFSLQLLSSGLTKQDIVCIWIKRPSTNTTYWIETKLSLFLFKIEIKLIRSGHLSTVTTKFL